MGANLVTKLWNVARFSERFLGEYRVPAELPAFTPTDRWLLSRTQRLILRATDLFRNYDYAAAKSETESFFWRELADNYVEMSKERLYDASNEMHEGARYTLYHVFLAVLKLFAPFLPYVTETIYKSLFAASEGTESIHAASWPQADETMIDDKAEAAGELLVELATAVRRYKSESNISLGAELQRLQLATTDPSIAELLQKARADIRSVTRAKEIEVSQALDATVEQIKADGEVKVGLARQPER
jgi:valyl-tRNA synthetase